MERVGGSQAQQEFCTGLLRDIYRGHCQLVKNNFDQFRFGFDDVDPSKPVNVDARDVDHHLILIHLASSVAAFQLFPGVTRRRLFIRLTTNRRLGHPCLRICEDMTWTPVQIMLQRAAGYETAPPSRSLGEAFGPLNNFYAINPGGRTISLDNWKDDLACCHGQGNHRHHFFDRNGVRIGPEPKNCNIDDSASFGCSGVFFACASRLVGWVDSFELLPAHIGEIYLSIDENKLENRMLKISSDLGERTNLATKRSFRRNRYSSRSRSNSHHAVLRCHQQSPSDIRPNHDCV